MSLEEMFWRYLDNVWLLSFSIFLILFLISLLVAKVIRPQWLSREVRRLQEVFNKAHSMRDYGFALQKRTIHVSPFIGILILEQTDIANRQFSWWNDGNFNWPGAIGLVVVGTGSIWNIILHSPRENLEPINKESHHYRAGYEGATTQHMITTMALAAHTVSFHEQLASSPTAKSVEFLISNVLSSIYTVYLEVFEAETNEDIFVNVMLAVKGSENLKVLCFNVDSNVRRPDGKLIPLKTKAKKCYEAAKAFNNGQSRYMPDVTTLENFGNKSYKAVINLPVVNPVTNLSIAVVNID
jgi:hypothetical protein